MHLRRKEECSDTHLGGGYLEGFGDDIPPRTTNNATTKPASVTIKPIADTESTVSSSPEEPVTTQEPGAFPAVPVQKYRDLLLEEIAVHNVRINRIINNRAVRNRQQEENVRSAELELMLDLETLMKETAADPDLLEIPCCWKTIDP